MRKCCFCVCMRVSYWNSPCIVPLTPYHTIPSFGDIEKEKEKEQCCTWCSKCKMFISDQSMYCPFNPLPHNPEFNMPGKKAFENIPGKAENAGNQHFLLFSRCFLLNRIDRLLCT